MKPNWTQISLLIVLLVLTSTPLLASAQSGTRATICLSDSTDRHVYSSSSSSESIANLRDGEAVTILGSVLMPQNRIRVRTQVGRVGYISTEAFCEWPIRRATPTPTPRVTSSSGFCDGPYLSGDGTIDSPAIGILWLTYTNKTGGLSIALTDLEQRDRIGTYNRPDNGYVFIVATVQVSCLSDTEDACRFNNLNFGLVVDGSYVVEPSSATYSLPDNNWSTVFPGGEVEGQLVFEVRALEAHKEMALYFGDRWVICQYHPG